MVEVHGLVRVQVTLYVSFYVEAVNRDAFMAVKQDLLLAFIDCVDRNGAKLAKQRLEVPPLPATPRLHRPQQWCLGKGAHAHWPELRLVSSRGFV